MKYQRDRPPLAQNRYPRPLLHHTMRPSPPPNASFNAQYRNGNSNHFHSPNYGRGHPAGPYSPLNQNWRWHSPHSNVDRQQIQRPDGRGWMWNGPHNNNSTATATASVTTPGPLPTSSSSNLSLIPRMPNPSLPGNSQFDQITQLPSLDEPLERCTFNFSNPGFAPSEIARTIWSSKSPSSGNSTPSDLQRTRSSTFYPTQSDMQRKEPIPRSTPLNSSGVLQMVKTVIPGPTPKDVPQDPRLLHSKFLQARMNKAITSMTQEKSPFKQASLPPPSEKTMLKVPTKPKNPSPLSTQAIEMVRRYLPGPQEKTDMCKTFTQSSKNTLTTTTTVQKGTTPDQISVSQVDDDSKMRKISTRSRTKEFSTAATTQNVTSLSNGCLNKVQTASEKCTRQNCAKFIVKDKTVASTGEKLSTSNGLSLSQVKTISGQSSNNTLTSAQRKVTPSTQKSLPQLKADRTGTISGHSATKTKMLATTFQKAPSSSSHTQVDLPRAKTQTHSIQSSTKTATAYKGPIPTESHLAKVNGKTVSDNQTSSAQSITKARIDKKGTPFGEVIYPQGRTISLQSNRGRSVTTNVKVTPSSQKHFPCKLVTVSEDRPISTNSTSTTLSLPQVNTISAQSDTNTGTTMTQESSALNQPIVVLVNSVDEVYEGLALNLQQQYNSTDISVECPPVEIVSPAAKKLSEIWTFYPDSRRNLNDPLEMPLVQPYSSQAEKVCDVWEVYSEPSHSTTEVVSSPLTQSCQTLPLFENSTINFNNATSNEIALESQPIQPYIPAAWPDAEFMTEVVPSMSQMLPFFEGSPLVEQEIPPAPASENFGVWKFFPQSGNEIQTDDMSPLPLNQMSRQGDKSMTSENWTISDVRTVSSESFTETSVTNRKTQDVSLSPLIQPSSPSSQVMAVSEVLSESTQSSSGDKTLTKKIFSSSQNYSSPVNRVRGLGTISICLKSQLITKKDVASSASNGKPKRSNANMKDQVPSSQNQKAEESTTQNPNESCQVMSVPKPKPMETLSTSNPPLLARTISTQTECENEESVKIQNSFVAIPCEYVNCDRYKFNSKDLPSGADVILKKVNTCMFKNGEWHFQRDWYAAVSFALKSLTPSVILGPPPMRLRRYRSLGQMPTEKKSTNEDPLVERVPRQSRRDSSSSEDSRSSKKLSPRDNDRRQSREFFGKFKRGGLFKESSSQERPASKKFSPKGNRRSRKSKSSTKLRRRRSSTESSSSETSSSSESSSSDSKSSSSYSSLSRSSSSKKSLSPDGQRLPTAVFTSSSTEKAALTKILTKKRRHSKKSSTKKRKHSRKSTAKKRRHSKISSRKRKQHSRKASGKKNRHSRKSSAKIKRHSRKYSRSTSSSGAHKGRSARKSSSFSSPERRLSKKCSAKRSRSSTAPSPSSPGDHPLRKSPPAESQPLRKSTSVERRFLRKSTSAERGILRKSSSPGMQPLRKSTSPGMQPLRKSTSPGMQPLRKSTSPGMQPLRKSTSPERQPLIRTSCPESTRPASLGTQAATSSLSSNELSPENLTSTVVHVQSEESTRGGSTPGLSFENYSSIVRVAPPRESLSHLEVDEERRPNQVMIPCEKLSSNYFFVQSQFLPPGTEQVLLGIDNCCYSSQLQRWYFPKSRYCQVLSALKTVEPGIHLIISRTHLDLEAPQQTDINEENDVPVVSNEVCESNGAVLPTQENILSPRPTIVLSSVQFQTVRHVLNDTSGKDGVSEKSPAEAFASGSGSPLEEGELVPTPDRAIPTSRSLRRLKIPGFEIIQHLVPPSFLPKTTERRFSQTISITLPFTSAQFQEKMIGKKIILRLVLTNCGEPVVGGDRKISIQEISCSDHPILVSRNTTGLRFNVEITQSFYRTRFVMVTVSATVDQCTSDDGICYCVCIVRKHNLNELLSHLKEKTRIPESRTRKMITDSFIEDVASGIVQNDSRLPTALFKCPLGLRLIETPCRGVSCKHYACFDAWNFLQFSEKAVSWRCPICKSPLDYEDLRVDSYFTPILRELRKCITMKHVIKISPDGKVSIASRELNDIGQGEQETIALIEDDDELRDTTEIASSNSVNVKGEALQSKNLSPSDSRVSRLLNNLRKKRRTNGEALSTSPPVKQAKSS